MYNKIMEDYSQNVLEKDNGTVIDIMIHEQRNIFQQLELQYEITKRKIPNNSDVLILCSRRGIICSFSRLNRSSLILTGLKQEKKTE